MIIGFNFGEPVFMHAILHAQDTINCVEPTYVGSSYLKNFFQNYEVFIGNSSNYTENTKCAGGPFLDPADSSSYVFSQKGYDSNQNPFSQGLGMVWPFG